MSAPGKPNDLQELRRLWTEWSTVVAQCIHRDHQRPIMTEAEYHALHERLINECDNAQRNATGAEKTVFQQLAALATPWLTLESLADADPEFQRDLVRRCYLAGKPLRTRPKHRVKGLPWVVVVLATFGAAFLTLVVYSFLTDNSHPGLFAETQRSMTWIRIVLARMSNFEKISILSIIVVLIGIRLVYNTKRF